MPSLLKATVARFCNSLALSLLVSIVAISFCSAAFGQDASADLVPSGISEIDSVRQQVANSPTTTETGRKRLSSLFSWYLLLNSQGYDMQSFEEVRPRLGMGTMNETVLRAIDEGYRTLEAIQRDPVQIEERRGEEHTGPVQRTDWPLFHGGQAQTGYTSDPGPSEGEVAWRFGVGHSWYASPTIEDGRVYMASPGMTTLMYSLDEETGEVIWKTRQNGLRIYGTPRAASDVVPLEDELVVRATSGSWEDDPGPVRYLFFIDKETGEVVRQEDAGLVDYRRGYAPVQGNDEYVVFPASRMDIRSMPASVWMFDTVVARETETGDIWWTFRVGTLFSEPLLTDEHVYAATEAGKLYSLNLPGPERIAWVQELEGPLRTTPTADGPQLYVGSNNGTFYAIDRAQGDVLWTFEASEEEPRAFQFFTQPTVADGRIYVGAANGLLYCLDAETGQLLWEYELEDWIRSRPFVLGDRVFVATVDGTLTGLKEGGSGSEKPSVLWSSKVSDHQILADLVGNENGVLVSTSDLWLQSVDPETGEMQWQHKLLESARIDGELVMADRVAAGSDYQSSPTVVDGTVFIGGPNRFVHAVDAETGREKWRYETSGQVSATPVVAEGKVCFGQQGGDKDFYCVDQEDGSPLWTQEVGWAWVGAGYADGRLFVGTVEGDVLGLDLKDGSVLWTHETNGGIYPAPATDDENVYTGSWDGYYLSLDQRTGEVKWAYATPGHTYERGGGPDSAAPILWEGNVIARVYPATQAAIDAKTGETVWLWKGPERHIMNATAAAHPHHDQIYTSAVVSYSPPLGAKLIALDDSTGEKIWEYQGAGGWPGASVTDDKVCVGSSTEPFFVCLDPEGNGDGTTDVLWRHKVGGIFEESVPAIYGDKAYVLCTDHYLYAFE